MLTRLSQPKIAQLLLLSQLRLSNRADELTLSYECTYIQGNSIYDQDKT